MRYEEYDLVVPASVAAGTAFDVQSYVNLVVVLKPSPTVGTTNGSTLQLQSSQDGITWVSQGGAISSSSGNTAVAVDGAWYQLRVSTTVYNSGTPAATLSAHNHRAS